MRSPSRFVKRSSTRAALLVGAAVLAAVAAILYASSGVTLLGALRLLAAIAALALVALYLILTQRERHREIEEELAGQATFLESLIESMHAIAAHDGPRSVLERAREEAERLFAAQVNLLEPGEAFASASNGTQGIFVRLRVRDQEIGALHLVRRRPFARSDVARATVLADFAARESENARLLEDAKVREAERARLSEQLLTAEQEERRRLALFLHDGPVQSMSGIALMLDAVNDAVSAEAKPVMERVLRQHRETIRALRDLSFHLEPVVLRDQGFTTAVKALAEQLGLEHQLQIDVDVAAAEALGEKVQAALYQIIRESLEASIRRGPPTRISVSVAELENGAREVTMTDDAPGERRRATFEALAERARTLNARFEVDQRGDDGGTTVRVTIPPYAAQ
jgi:signal transduction histidine kinase